MRKKSIFDELQRVVDHWIIAETELLMVRVQQESGE